MASDCLVHYNLLSGCEFLLTNSADAVVLLDSPGARPLSCRPLFMDAAAIANAAHHSLPYCSSKQWLCVRGARQESDTQINEFLRFCLHTMSL